MDDAPTSTWTATYSTDGIHPSYLALVRLEEQIPGGPTEAIHLVFPPEAWDAIAQALPARQIPVADPAVRDAALAERRRRQLASALGIPDDEDHTYTDLLVKVREKQALVEARRQLLLALGMHEEDGRDWEKILGIVARQDARERALATGCHDLRERLRAAQARLGILERFAAKVSEYVEGTKATTKVPATPANGAQEAMNGADPDPFDLT